MNFKTLKQNLAVVFDDDLHTKKWHNIVDWLIIFMIVVSTAEIFISTFNVSPQVRRILLIIDIVTLIFFTVEVSLRIWVAPLVNPKYSGWKGRLRYCFSFNGFIDILSTYPYYLQWLIPVPITWLKVLRISRTMRVFRISRYMKSWRLLTNALSQKRNELIISLQFLIIVTFALSLILFFCEHDAQPDVYDNGFTSVLWAFAQYIGDPGHFGETPPITVPGKVIACIVGILGIAIVAVPAGILGAGFTEAIEVEASRNKINRLKTKLRNSFIRKLDRPSGYQIIPPFVTLPNIQARQSMTEDDIINTINESEGFRLVNLGDTYTIDKNATPVLAVEYFDFNRPYGLCIDRGSKMTIISPSNFVHPCTGFFSYYIALMGGFNYISREFGEIVPYKSWYIPKHELTDEREKLYFEDMRKLVASQKDPWTLTFLVASGANEPEYDCQVHFSTGNKKGDESIGEFIKDKERYAIFYKAVSSILKDEFDISTDNGKYHNNSSKKHFLRSRDIPAAEGHIIMRVAWSAMLWDPRRILLAQAIAEAINKYILGLPGNPEVPVLKVKDVGFK